MAPLIYAISQGQRTHSARTNFRSRRWGSSLQGLRTLDPSLGAIGGRARLYVCNENSGVPKLLCCRVTFEHLLKPLIGHIQRIGTQVKLCEISRKTLKKTKNAPSGDRGPPNLVGG